MSWSVVVFRATYNVQNARRSRGANRLKTHTRSRCSVLSHQNKRKSNKTNNKTQDNHNNNTRTRTHTHAKHTHTFSPTLVMYTSCALSVDSSMVMPRGFVMFAIISSYIFHSKRWSDRIGPNREQRQAGRHEGRRRGVLIHQAGNRVACWCLNSYSPVYSKRLDWVCLFPDRDRR